MPTYGVLAAAGLVCAMLLAEWCSPRAGVPGPRIWNLCLVMALGTLVLSRVLLILQSPRAFRTYPALLLTLPTVTRFGLLLAMLSGALFVIATRLPWLRTMDALAAPALLLTAFLQMGSFFAGTDPGSGTSLCLGRLVRGDEGHHPVALYAATLSLLGAAVALTFLLRRRGPGECSGVALAIAAVGRFVCDEFRPSFVLPDLYLAGTHLRIDQVILLALTAAGMLLLLERPAHA